jgi:galactose oxidase
MMRTLRINLCLLAATALMGAPAQGQASSLGEWSSTFPLPLPAVHAVMLPPDGRLMLLSYNADSTPWSPGTWCWVLDPVALTTVPYPLPVDNMYCSGHSLMANGDVLIAGGTGSAMNQGHPLAYTFNETTGWTQTGTMNVARWYPTVTHLGDGRYIAMAGADEVRVDTALVETFDPQTQTWTVLPGADKLLPWYPMLFQVPSGAVIAAGPQRRTESLDPNTGVWTYVDDTAKDHNEGCAVLLPPYPDRIMVIGGHNKSRTITRKKCEILDLSAPVPQWRATAPMKRRRQDQDAVLLPNGQVLVVGGRRIEKEIDKRSTQGPFFRTPAVLEAEMFDPVTETWTLMAAQARPRVYHSTAVLLRDGRVFSAGGEFETEGEIYSPPYLFKGPRPTLTGVPASVGYGSTFQVSSDQAGQIASACLIAPAAVTHSLDMNQRFIAVTVADMGGGVLDITAPALNTVAPAGYYMLFLVNSSGIPSVAEFIQLQ